MGDPRNGNTRTWVIAFASSILTTAALTFTITNAMASRREQIISEKLTKIEAQGSEAFRIFQARLDAQIANLVQRIEATNQLVKDHIVSSGGK